MYAENLAFKIEQSDYNPYYTARQLFILQHTINC